MCGIVGYIGPKQAVPILLYGLSKLEYRGYDSAGICVIDQNILQLVKKKGKIADLTQAPKLSKLNGTVGIAHTRWATHGEPNEINAHPHLDCKKEVAIVHNGIIENYQSLKSLLIKEGHKIISQTDSEILAHLIEKFYQGDLMSAVQKALKMVEGAYGLAVIHKNENKIVIAKKGSPLIIGVGKGEMFVASDATAILNHTKKVIYLKDNEIAEINSKNCTIKTLDGKKIAQEIHQIKWNVQQIEKGGFKHYMAKEIFEQPEAIANTLRGRIRQNKIKLSININPKNTKRIFLIACGTSWHSALIGKFFIESIAKIPVEVDYASEFRYRNPIITKDDAAIFISQSGETADTIAAMHEAKDKDANTIGIVNVVGSTIARETLSGLYLHAGPEIGVASTKAFTCQITALLLLALYLKQQKGERLDKKILYQISQIPNYVKNILKSASKIKKIAAKYQKCPDFLYLGRGINFPVALEGALKLKEISYIHAEGYPAAEMKHGPIALIDKNVPSVFVAPNDKTFEKTMSNIQEVKARRGKIIAISNSNEKRLSNLTDELILVPATLPEISPIINIIPLQLLSYYIADYKKINMDKPRNLAKSVTVE